MEEKERIEAAVVEEPVEVPRSSWVLVAQFFFVPLIIVGLCVGVFVLFGLITGENRTAREYLEEVKAGKGNRRWQAAFELSKYLNYRGDKKHDPRLGKDLSAAFVSAKDDDPRIRQYLALALGRLQDKAAVEPLIQSLEESNPETRIYVVCALGELGDARAVEPLLKLAQSADPGLRKITMYSLGLLQDPRALPELQAALNDKVQDVRWNAALALARFRDSSGVEVLHQMLDRGRLSESTEVTESQKAEAIKSAVRAVALLKDASARPLLDELSRNDPDIEVRAAAMEALKRIP